MNEITFVCAAPRCQPEQKAYDDAKALANDAMIALRAALTAQIGAELAACGIDIGSPVVATLNGWRPSTTERGILRRWDHNDVTVAKRNKDGSAHATQNLSGVKSMVLDVEAAQ